MVSIRKNTILVVDDQSGIRLLLNEVFTNEGYDVIEAGTGKEALEKIEQHSIDLIMIDFNLPIFNASEVLQQLEEDRIEIPVILMSGLIESIVWKFEKPDMVIDIVEKPFNIKDISDIVHTILVKEVL